VRAPRQAERRFVPGDENAIKLLGSAGRAGGRRLERCR
jgi:hypothetical protein